MEREKIDKIISFTEIKIMIYLEYFFSLSIFYAIKLAKIILKSIKQLIILRKNLLNSMEYYKKFLAYSKLSVNEYIH